MNRPYPSTQGPFRADQIREGDPYELAHGHAVRCLPTGGRGSEATATDAAILKSDPQVESAGVDTGFSPTPDTSWTPDVAVGDARILPGPCRPETLAPPGSRRASCQRRDRVNR